MWLTLGAHDTYILIKIYQLEGTQNTPLRTMLPADGADAEVMQVDLFMHAVLTFNANF